MDNLDYGIIGNCRSAALVSKTGSIDWCCLPEFDSPSVFAKLLDEEIGGSFEIKVSDTYVITQKYEPFTNILITTFIDGENHFEIHDFMPRYRKHDNTYHAPPELVRYFKLISGTPEFSILYDPKLGYAMGKTESFIKKDFVASLTHDVKFDTIFLYNSFDKEYLVKGEEIELKEDGFVMVGYNEKLLLPTIERVYLDLQNTKVYWLNGQTLLRPIKNSIKKFQEVP